jgi:hypothetical protein
MLTHPRPQPDCSSNESKSDANVDRAGRQTKTGFLRTALPGLFLVSLLYSSCSTTRTVSPASDDGSRWWSHVEFLANDNLKGRFTGSEGYLKTSDYTAQQFQSLGLKAAGSSGYFQPIEFETRRVIPEKSSFELVLKGRIIQLKVPDDVALSVSGQSGKIVEAPMVFTGYGITVPENHYDDFAGMKTQGAVSVRLSGGAPKSVPPLLASYYASGEAARKHARELGLAGTLGLINPKVIDLPWPRLVNSIMTMQLKPDLPAFEDRWQLPISGAVNPAVADQLLAGTGHTLEELTVLNKERKPLPHFTIPAKLRTKVVYESGKLSARNVVAMIPGSDPTLKNEYVLISAHLDHIGVGRPVNGDSIYNGAMDNASGVATLIEAARRIQAGPPPKRSILFLACNGEEEGELGSEAFAAQPTVPIKSIVADINLDMYLPLFPLKILRAYGLNESDLQSYVEAAAKKNGILVQDDPHPEQNIFIRSDQYSFIKKGIPSIFLSFGYKPGTPEEKIVDAWFKERYHGPADDTKQSVDKQAAAKFNQLMATLAVRIADAARRPKWNSRSFFQRFVQ